MGTQEVTPLLHKTKHELRGHIMIWAEMPTHVCATRAPSKGDSFHHTAVPQVEGALNAGVQSR